MDQAIEQTPTTIIPQRIEANTFTFQGRRVSVTFSATSFTGQPLLHYKDRQREVDARGDEIRIEKSEIGTLVTVTLEPDADAGSLLFTLIIPRVALATTTDEEDISAVAITTRSRLPPRLPASVQLQTYETVELKGIANFVVA